MNTQALGLNGQAILYSPPGTGKSRHDPRHPHVSREKSSMTPSKPTLPSNQAFVVQFRTRPRGAPSWGGRVEHLASYQVARFHSLDELLAFMRRVLTEVEAQPGAE
jgi:hypothetical protein